MPTEIASAAASSDWIATSLDVIRQHQSWAVVIFGAMAFGESLVVVGVLIPATTVMIACGPLVATGVLSFWQIFAGGVIGAVIGDSLSFWLGEWLGPRAETIWPFRDRPQILAWAERIFARWGWMAVFFGRFIGPLRATIPLAAGILRMRPLAFQAVNVLSAVAWIPALLAPGAAVGWIWQLAEGGRVGDAVELAAAAATLLAIAFFAGRWAYRRIVEGAAPGADGRAPD